MIQQFIDNHKKALAIALILIAVVLIGGITVFVLSDPPDNDVAVVGTSSEESSAPTSSVTVSVPEIKSLNRCRFRLYRLHRNPPPAQHLAHRTPAKQKLT